MGFRKYANKIHDAAMRIMGEDAVLQTSFQSYSIRVVFDRNTQIVDQSGAYISTDVFLFRLFEAQLQRIPSQDDLIHYSGKSYLIADVQNDGNGGIICQVNEVI